jgi:hypothetical protein
LIIEGKAPGAKTGRARVPARRQDLPPLKEYFGPRSQRVLDFDNSGSRGRDPSLVMDAPTI